MATVPLLLLLYLFRASLATHCDKELNYHDNHGYGIDITCEDLSDKTEKMLKNVSVSNEIQLNINNSNLTKVTPDLFASVPKIKYLSITNSTFTFDQSDRIFSKLLRLEHLTVENTRFDLHSAHVLKGLDGLKELNLINCNLKRIRNESFAMLENLEMLRLSYNHFRSVFDIPFCELSALKFLDLDHNEIKEIDDNFLVCLENEEESGFMLNGRDYEIQYHKDDFYHQAKSSFNLHELNLSYNQISSVGDFDWALGLKYVDLSNNKVRNINSSIFGRLKDLEKLSLQNNLLETVDMAFDGLHNMKCVNLENNSLTQVHLTNLSSLEDVNLSKNKLVSSSLTHLVDLPILQKLFLHDNDIHSLPTGTLNFRSLEVLDLSNNKLVLRNESFQNLSNLRHLSLRNNNLVQIPATTFSKLSSLELLDISGNKLGPFLDYQTFIGLDSVEMLNISNNVLENLNYELVKPLRNLQVLDISGNRLQNFQINLISLLPSLRVINIKSNLLSCTTLSTIITFLKSKDISFTINEEFEYDRQNVDGIYCEEMGRMLSVHEENNIGVSMILGIVFLVVVSSMIFSFVFYKCLLYSKRRGYTNDELELL